MHRIPGTGYLIFPQPNFVSHYAEAVHLTLHPFRHTDITPGSESPRGRATMSPRVAVACDHGTPPTRKGDYAFVSIILVD